MKLLDVSQHGKYDRYPSCSPTIVFEFDYYVPSGILYGVIDGLTSTLTPPLSFLSNGWREPTPPVYIKRCKAMRLYVYANMSTSALSEIPPPIKLLDTVCDYAKKIAAYVEEIAPCVGRVQKMANEQRYTVRFQRKDGKDIVLVRCDRHYDNFVVPLDSFKDNDKACEIWAEATKFFLEKDEKQYQENLEKCRIEQEKNIQRMKEELERAKKAKTQNKTVTDYVKELRKVVVGTGIEVA